MNQFFSTSALSQNSLIDIKVFHPGQAIINFLNPLLLFVPARRSELREILFYINPVIPLFKALKVIQC